MLNKINWNGYYISPNYNQQQNKDIVKCFIHLFLHMPETSFYKNTTYQGRGMGIRKLSKEDKDASENNETGPGGGSTRL